ncbi:hypothetical protein C5467_24255, partial [Photorhabdus khanii subsp. guanajuatensis]
HNVLTVVFIPFNICFLLSLIIIGYCILRLTNTNHIHFLSLLTLFFYFFPFFLFSFFPFFLFSFFPFFLNYHIVYNKIYQQS